MTRWSPVLCLLLSMPASSPIAHLRYERLIAVEHSGQTCVVLSPSLYLHASASLADLRLYTNAGAREIPYALLESGSLQAEAASAQILNLRQAGKSVSFDLQMPARAYTDVILSLANQSPDPGFVVRATVSAAGVPLGDFTLFNLTAEHLPEDTTLHLQETTVPLLHITLSPPLGTIALLPAMVQGASVPPSRDAQTLYTTALRTSTVTQAAQETRVHFLVPAHMPIERVRFTLVPGPAPNFTRAIRITSQAAGMQAAEDPAASGEQIHGAIGHLHTTRRGVVLSFDQMSVPATLGANLQTAAEVEVAIENGTAAPLPIASVALETRQRQLCFDAQTAGLVTLFYGDPQLEPPQYPFARSFLASATPHLATLGPEQLNPRFTPANPVGFLKRRHPRSAYLGLILAVCFAGLFLLRSKKLRL